MAGVDIRTVQEVMGHKDISMTVRYAHLAHKFTLAAVERLTGSSSSSPEPSREPTDTKTSTSGFEQVSAEAAYV